MRPLIRQTQIDQAADCLKKGGLVAMPTETVYGLAADASNDAAVRKIFAAKGRPADHPLIVHIASIKELPHWAIEIPDYAFKLAEQYWPGPMTLILKKQAHVLDSVTGRQNTVGIRIPQHTVAQQLLKAFGGGLAAPSANRFGQISPTSAAHVQKHLGDVVDIILDGGNCGIGIESTIIDCSGDSPRILRPGMITETMLKDTIGLGASLRWHDTLDKTPESPRVSGELPSHYAPQTLTRLLDAKTIDNILTNTETKNIVILSSRKPIIHHIKLYDSRVPHRSPYIDPNICSWIVMPTEPYAYAHHLYQQLHFADSLHCQEILIEHVPDAPEWIGILDRITKASNHKR
ncbi:MAG: threonylcarbamoyl-AMP synthase [Gammaproteobacteria bacterium]|nr:threonylcarbamoyl-AMP synthase [Gammaproteobacteria bacterium]